VFPHLLQGTADSHLGAGNRDNSVEEIEIGKLAVNPIIDYMKRFEAVVEGVIDYDSALECAAL